MTAPGWIAAAGAAVELAIGVYMAWLVIGLADATFMAPLVVAVAAAVTLGAVAVDRREPMEADS